MDRDEWPFLIDQWGEGKAFQCKAADCGAELNLYIRANAMEPVIIQFLRGEIIQRWVTRTLGL
jgi:hypothetical protein